MLDDRPTARALRTWELVQSRPGITARQIGDELGVSDRAARRYVATLREAGVGIESTPGPHGGYALGRGVRTSPLLFTAEELMALVMTALEAPGPASEPATRDAVAKLLRALPRHVGTPARAVHDTAAVVLPETSHRPSSAVVLELVSAAAQHHRVLLDYRLPDGREIARTVEPWAVVVRWSYWYLLCRSVDGMRAYRADRVLAVHPTDEHFDPPEPFDAAALLEAHLASTWDHPVVVEFDAPQARVRPCLLTSMGRLEPLDDDRCRLVGTTGNPTGYAADLAQVPVPFRVVEGSEVRGALAGLAARLQAASSG